MSPLEWDRCYQLAIPTFGVALAAFGLSQTSWATGKMVGDLFLASSAGFLCAGLVLASLSVARHPLVKRWREHKKLLWVTAVAVVVIAIGSALFLVRVRSITESERGAVLGVGAVLLLEGLRRLWWRRYRLKRKDGRENIISRESAEQLRQVHRVMVQTIGSAVNYVNYILEGSEPKASARLVSRLLRDFVVRDVQDAYSKTYPRIESDDFTDAEFAELLDAINEVHRQYATLGKYLIWSGTAFLEAAFFRTPGYLTWYGRHGELLAEFKRIAARKDIGQLAVFGGAVLGDLLPPPEEPDTAKIQGT